MLAMSKTTPMTFNDILDTYPNDDLWQSASVVVAVREAGGIKAAAKALDVGEAYLENMLRNWDLYDEATKPSPAVGTVLSGGKIRALHATRPGQAKAALVAAIKDNGYSVEQTAQAMGTTQQSVRRLCAYVGVDLKALLRKAK